MTMLMALGALGAAQAGEIGATQAFAVNTIGHGVWLAGVGGAMAGGDGGALAVSAGATHVNLLVTPVFLHQVEPMDADAARRLQQAWVLYYAGLGVTAAGWGIAGLTAEEGEGVPGLVVMVLADAALIGATSLAAREMVRKDMGSPPPTPVVPLVVSRF
jgi:hypothetical protein